jgi:putative membrane protein
MTRTILALLLSSAFALTACQNNNAADNNTMAADDLNAMTANDMTATDMNGTAMTSTVDSAFLTDAMKGDNSEVALGKIAQSKGASQGVKDLGSMLVTDHGAHKTEVASLAQQAGVAVTDDIMDEAKTMETKLNGLSGDAFDKAFIAGAIEDHKKDIAKYEAQAKSGDPQTAALANKTLPTLKKHLETAQKLQK